MLTTTAQSLPTKRVLPRAAGRYFSLQDGSELLFCNPEPALILETLEAAPQQVAESRQTQVDHLQLHSVS